MTILLGMGTGRSGTQSLSQLLNAQTGTVCFHELNPACMKWKDTPQTVRSMVREFEGILKSHSRDVTLDFTRPAKDEGLDRLRDLPSVNTIGDVAFYYLPYVPMLAKLDLNIKMPCMKRDRSMVIDSFMRAVSIPKRKPRNPKRILGLLGAEPPTRRHNHWQVHDGSQWALNPKWDKLFPKFDAADLEDSIGRYWDFYQQEAEKFAALYPDSFRIFDVDSLNSDVGQEEILKFCEIAEPLNFEKHHSNKILLNRKSV